MTTVLNQLQKILRQHHISLIRIQYGFNSSRWSSSTVPVDEMKNESVSAKHIDASTSESNTPRDTSIEFSQTPKKYRRRPLTQDEIDLLTVGGSI